MILNYDTKLNYYQGRYLLMHVTGSFVHYIRSPCFKKHKIFAYTVYFTILLEVPQSLQFLISYESEFDF